MKIVPIETFQIFSQVSKSNLELIIIEVFDKNCYNFSWNTFGDQDIYAEKQFYASANQPFPFFGYKPEFHGKINSIQQGKTEIILIAKLSKNAKRLFLIWLYIMLPFVAISLPIVIIELIHGESQIWTMTPTILFIVGYWTFSFFFYRKSRVLTNRLKRLLH